MYVLRIIFPGRVKNWSTVEITTIEGVTVLHKTTLAMTQNYPGYVGYDSGSGIMNYTL